MTPEPTPSLQTPFFRLRIPREWAYILPMALFMLCVWIGGHWPQSYPATYAIRTFLVAISLVVFWRCYTKIRWDYWWLGALVGVVGIVQWVGMEKFLQHFLPALYSWEPKSDPFVPADFFHSPWTFYAFIAVRWAGATLVVPLMEELFWRDYLWRQLLAPNDFNLASVGEWDWRTYFIVAGAFATVHPQWMTAIAWALMIGGLLAYTKSLGACIIAHAVTNFLLGAYVLIYREWSFW